MTISRLALVIALAAAAGCGGGPKYVPVSGVVTVDGQPYKNAVVSFQPVAAKDGVAAGRGSGAVTDEKGRFTLYADDGTPGAVAGKHRIRIQTQRASNEVFFDPQVGSPDNAPAPAAKKGQVDPIPVEWYSDKVVKEFEVPADGTDKADFAITSIHAGKKK
jgi:predicted small lipoprotein YifL